jgi:hypothetical protein
MAEDEYARTVQVGGCAGAVVGVLGGCCVWSTFNVVIWDWQLAQGS